MMMMTMIWTPRLQIKRVLPDVLNDAEMQQRLLQLLQDQRKTAAGRRIAGITTTNTTTTTYKKRSTPHRNAQFHQRALLKTMTTQVTLLNDSRHRVRSSLDTDLLLRYDDLYAYYHKTVVVATANVLQFQVMSPSSERVGFTTDGYQRGRGRRA